MSGVEAAGFVLAALPLLISGLEHYANGAETIKRAWNYSREFKSLARKLDAEKTVFQNSIEILLDDCVDVDLQNKLMGDIGGKSWSEPTIERALRQRLRGSFGSYVECVGGIQDTVALLQRNLRLGAKSKVPYDDQKSFKRACQSLHFAMRHSKYKELVRDIRDDNITLERLSTQTHLLQTSRKSKRLPDFDRTRAEATSIFECLQRGLHDTCNMPHRASLYLKLEEGDANKTRARPTPTEGAAFRIVVYHELVPGIRVPWVMEETELRVIDSAMPSLGDDLPTSFHDLGLAQSTTRTTKIQIQEPPRTADSRTSSLRQAQMKGYQQRNLAEIRDLCESMHKYRDLERGSCLGYVTGSSTRSRHGLYWPRERLLDRTMTLSLAHILSGKPDQFGCRLRHADAHWLAASLSSAMLRLHDTPWMPKEWTTKDVMLVSQHGRLLSHHPFMSRSLQAGALESPALSRTTSMAQRVIRNPALYRLGILLIELCMNKPMQQLHLPDEVDADGTPHDLSDYYAATRLLELEEIRDRFGKRWSEAISRCLQCSFSKPSLQDLDLRREFYNGVVLELDEAYRQFCDL